MTTHIHTSGARGLPVAQGGEEGRPATGTRGYRSPKPQFRKHAGKALEANTMAYLHPHHLLAALPADELVAPGAHNGQIPLAGRALARLLEHLLGRGYKRT